MKHLNPLLLVLAITGASISGCGQKGPLSFNVPPTVTPIKPQSQSEEKLLPENSHFVPLVLPPAKPTASNDQR